MPVGLVVGMVGLRDNFVSDVVHLRRELLETNDKGDEEGDLAENEGLPD